MLHTSLMVGQRYAYSVYAQLIIQIGRLPCESSGMKNIILNKLGKKNRYDWYNIWYNISTHVLLFINVI